MTIESRVLTGWRIRIVAGVRGAKFAGRAELDAREACEPCREISPHEEVLRHLAHANDRRDRGDRRAGDEEVGAEHELVHVVDLAVVHASVEPRARAIDDLAEG